MSIRSLFSIVLVAVGFPIVYYYSGWTKAVSFLLAFLGGILFVRISRKPKLD
jgi:hypothetical protein